MMQASPFSGSGSREERRQWLLLALALGVAAAAFAACYVAQEQPAYTYDFGAYWHAYRTAGTQLLGDPFLWLVVSLRSIRTEDYNFAPTIALMPSYLLFGGGRTAYVASLAALYVVPAAMLASRLADGRTMAEARLALLAALTFPVFWHAAMRGMPDVVGLIPLSLATMRLRQSGCMRKATGDAALTTGLLLWLTFMFRRWYAFAVVALIAVSLAACVIGLLSDARREGRSVTRAEIVTSLRLWTRLAAGLLLPLLIVQGPLVWTILTTNYAGIYSAYQESAAGHIADYHGWFGPVIVLLAAAGTLRDIRRKAWDTVFCLAVAILTALLFALVQAPSVHHPMPIALMMFPAYFSGLSWLWSALPRPARLAVPAFLVLNFANAFAPATRDTLEAARSLLQDRRYPPLHLEQYAEYRRLLEDLAQLPAESRFAVYASSDKLSASLLAELEPPLGPRFVWTGEVDLRDRVGWMALRADYAIVADPTPIHLNPDGQRVISLPAEEIKAGQGIGASYRLLRGGYRLDGGYVAAIYRRVALVPPAEVYRLAARFHGAYPDWKETESRVAMLMASSTLSLGEGGGWAGLAAPSTIVLRPGARTATTLTFPTGAPFAATSLHLSVGGGDGAACPRGSGPKVSLAAGRDAEPQLLDAEAPDGVPLPPAPGTAILSVSPRDGAQCSQAVAAFGFAPW